jgi:branched-subunit amino acid transport protein
MILLLQAKQEFRKEIRQTLPATQNFALLFGLIAPVMGLASCLASRFEIALPAEEPQRKPFAEVIDLTLGIAAGLAAMVFALYENIPVSIIFMLVSTGLFIVHFRDLLCVRILRLIGFMMVIFTWATRSLQNMSLYSE